VSVMRFYPRPDLEGHPKVTVLPLGYHWTINSKANNCLAITPHPPFREQDWTFLGTGWQNREQLLAPLKDISGVRCHARYFKNWNDPEAAKRGEYISELLDSLFVPCPEGQNPETFRFYEALECGAVPLVVRTPKSAYWMEYVSNRLPLILLRSWKEAADLIGFMKADMTRYEQYREKLLTAWMTWKEKLREDVGKWLQP
jgi:hypothetical protein